MKAQSLLPTVSFYRQTRSSADPKFSPDATVFWLTVVLFLTAVVAGV